MKNVVNRVPDPDEANARAGMFAPRAVLLEEGSYIYRFASHTANFGYHAGAWWIRHEDFDAIVARAKRAGVDLGHKARWVLSVLPACGSKMNVAMEARKPKRVVFLDDSPLPTANRPCAGVYSPGLVDYASNCEL